MGAIVLIDTSRAKRAKELANCRTNIHLAVMCAQADLEAAGMSDFARVLDGFMPNFDAAIAAEAAR